MQRNKDVFSVYLPQYSYDVSQLRDPQFPEALFV